MAVTTTTTIIGLGKASTDDLAKSSSQSYPDVVWFNEGTGSIWKNGMRYGDGLDYHQASVGVVNVNGTNKAYTDGYLWLCRIKVKAAYSNREIKIGVSMRGLNDGVIHICCGNNATLNQNQIDKAYVTGILPTVVLQRSSDTITTMFDVYIHVGQTWDEIGACILNKTFTGSQFSVEWKGTVDRNFRAIEDNGVILRTYADEGRKVKDVGTYAEINKTGSIAPFEGELVHTLDDGNTYKAEYNDWYVVNVASKTVLMKIGDEAVFPIGITGKISDSKCKLVEENGNVYLITRLVYGNADSIAYLNTKSNASYAVCHTNSSNATNFKAEYKAVLSLRSVGSINVTELFKGEDHKMFATDLMSHDLYCEENTSNNVTRHKVDCTYDGDNDEYILSYKIIGARQVTYKIAHVGINMNDPVKDVASNNMNARQYMSELTAREDVNTVIIKSAT